MSRRYSSLVIFLGLALWTAPCGAENDWSLGQLNPFKKRPGSGERIRASLSDKAAAESGSPAADSRAASGGLQATSQPRDPSMLTKVNRGTKALFSMTWDKTTETWVQTKQVLGKTKKVLMPWERKEPTANHSSPQYGNRDSSLFPSWWPKKEEKKRPNSVKEFLSLPRPGY
ncbi:MAG: hypothetical protein ACODAD_11675 [Planctomycetota bacterium]